MIYLNFQSISLRKSFRLLRHPKFRAAYDFLLLRCESGEVDPEIGQWWTRLQEENPEVREKMLAASGGLRKKRRRRRRPRAAPAGDED